MYEIVTLQSADRVVNTAIEAIVNGESHIPQPAVFRLVTENNVQEIRGAGTAENVLVIVGHANANKLSGYATWRAYCGQLAQAPAGDYNSVYVVACSTAGEGDKFGYGNIATEIKAAYADATVWASSTPVTPPDLTGHWEKQ